MEEKQNKDIVLIVLCTLLVCYLLTMAFGRFVDLSSHAADYFFSFARRVFDHF